MVLVTIIIGVVMATTSVVSGLLTYYELRQANDTEESSMAFYAADAGMEKTLACYFFTQSAAELDNGCNFGEPPKEAIKLSNTAEVSTNLKCVGADLTTQVSCADNDLVSGFIIKSFGSVRKTERVLQTFFAVKRNL